VFFTCFFCFFERFLKVAVFVVRVGRFVARVVSGCFLRSFCFLLCLFCIWTSYEYYLGGVSFGVHILALFRFSLADLLWFFLVCCFLADTIRGKYRRAGPCGHSNVFFACRPIVYEPTASIRTIHGYPRASDLVCEVVGSVNVCFCPCAHVVKSCVCVFVDVLGVGKGVRGVVC